MAYTSPNDYGNQIDLDVTVVSNQILESAAKVSILKNLVTNRRFAGAGMTMNLNQIDALSFSSHTEGDEITSETVDINSQTATMVEYTCDVHYGTIGRNYSGADAVAAFIDEMARAYARGVDALLATAIQAATGNDVDHNGTMTLESAASAYANLVADGAPPPYYLVLTPDDWASLHSGGIQLLNIGGGGAPFVGGPSPQFYVGRISGFEAYVSPYATRTQFFSPRGVEWIWKPIDHPGDNAGEELNIGKEWRPDFRSEMVYGTYIGDAIVRNPNGTAGGWVGNIYNAA